MKCNRAECSFSSGSAQLDKIKQSTGTEVLLILEILTFDPLVCQGFLIFLKSGPGACPIWEKKAYGPSKLGKLGVV